MCGVDVQDKAKTVIWKDWKVLSAAASAAALFLAFFLYPKNWAKAKGDSDNNEDTSGSSDSDEVDTGFELGLAKNKNPLQESPMPPPAP